MASVQDIAKSLGVSVKKYSDYAVPSSIYVTAKQVYALRPVLSAYTLVSEDLRASCMKNLVASPWTAALLDDVGEISFNAKYFSIFKTRSSSSPIQFMGSASSYKEPIKQLLNLYVNLVVYCDMIKKLYRSANLNEIAIFESMENGASAELVKCWDVIVNNYKSNKIDYTKAQELFNISASSFDLLINKPISNAVLQDSYIYYKNNSWRLIFRDLKSSSASASKEIAFPNEQLAQSAFGSLKSGFAYQTKLNAVPTLVPFEYTSITGSQGFVSKLNEQIETLQSLLLTDLTNASAAVKATIASTLNETLIRINVLKAAIIKSYAGSNWNQNFENALILTAYTGGELLYWNSRSSSAEGKAAAGSTTLRLFSASDVLTSLLKNLGATLVNINNRITVDQLPSFVPSSVKATILPLVPAASTPKTAPSTYDTGTSSGPTTAATGFSGAIKAKLQGIEKTWSSLPTDYETALAIKTKLSSDYRAALALLPKQGAPVAGQSYGTVDYAKAQLEADRILATLVIIRAIIVMHYTDVTVDNQILGLLSNFKRATIDYLGKGYQVIEESSKIGKNLRKAIDSRTFAASLSAINAVIMPIESSITGPPVPDATAPVEQEEPTAPVEPSESSEDNQTQTSPVSEPQFEPSGEYQDYDETQTQPQTGFMPDEFSEGGGTKLPSDANVPSDKDLMAPRESVKPWYMQPATLVAGAAIAYIVYSQKFKK